MDAQEAISDPQSNLQVRVAQVVLGCKDINPTLRFFVERLGFRVLEIFPADKPSVCVLQGHGLLVRLTPEGPLDPGTLRLECESAPGVQAELTAPNGTRILLVGPSAPYVMPSLEQEFVLSRMGQTPWGEGRAGMRYRDLIPCRLGGCFIASHIQIQKAGLVPDYVHFHRVRFQMIYCVRGWVRLVYEDQGEPFVLRAGDCVLQPPQIRHRVLECSAGLEVVEVGCPAEHETCADPSLELPTERLLPERDFLGQSFLKHVAEEAVWEPWKGSGFEGRDIGMQTATDGLAGAQVLRPAGSSGAVYQQHSGEFHFVYVLSGKFRLQRKSEPDLELGTGDACVLPAGVWHRFVQPSDDCELLQVTLPGTPGFQLAT